MDTLNAVIMLLPNWALFMIGLFAGIELAALLVLIVQWFNGVISNWLLRSTDAELQRRLESLNK